MRRAGPGISGEWKPRSKLQARRSSNRPFDQHRHVVDVADRHQGAQLRVLCAKIAADLGPDMRPATVGQAGLVPLIHLPVPPLRQAQHARGREPSHPGPSRICRASAISPLDTPSGCHHGEHLNARGLPRMRRNQRRPEHGRLAGAGAGLGNPHRDRPRAGLNLASRPVAASHHRSATGRPFDPVVAGEQLTDLGFQHQLGLRIAEIAVRV